jgi:hypothetical protein
MKKSVVGRKPVHPLDKKESVSIYLKPRDIENLGGKPKVRYFMYENIKNKLDEIKRDFLTSEK